MDELLNNIPEADLPHGFDQVQWEEIINSDELGTDSSTASQFSNDEITDKQNVAKLSIFNTITSLIISHEFITLHESIRILISPCLNQRVRYEKECTDAIRYVSVPQNGTITIQIPDLRSSLLPNEILLMRITRTTIDNGENKLIFYHPYPIWIKNQNAKIHHGSIFIQITETDMKNGFFQIANLAMIRLKQQGLRDITTMRIYSPNQLDFTDFHPVVDKIAKRIRDEYNLRYSVLNFQLIYVNQNNIAYPTNCFCQTEPIREIQADGK